MAMVLGSTTITMQVAATPTKATTLLSSGLRAPLSQNGSVTLTDGITTGKADKIWFKQSTIALSSSETWDLSSLTDVFGDAVAFVKVKLLYVKAAAGNTNNVIIGAAAGTQFVGPFGSTTHTVAVPPSGCQMFTNPTTGWVVSTGVSLKIANSGAGTGVTYDIIIAGTSA